VEAEHCGDACAVHGAPAGHDHDHKHDDKHDH